MKTTRSKGLILFLCLSVSLAGADTFKNLSTGETFNGFKTHKRSGDKVLVFNAASNQYAPMNLSEYQVTTNEEGRRDSVMIVNLNQPEILLSEMVSTTVAEAILKAADSGPKAIIIQIDSPGGQGPYMKTAAEAVTTAINDTGCRVVAYLPGGQYGGAFSAAAVVALACQQIYIAPTASIGAVGPVTSAAMPDDQYTQYLDMYTPDVLSTFSMYAVSLAAQNNRPELLARALVDKHLAIAEVRDSNGNESLVEVSQRQENQSVVRMITEGLSSGTTESGTPGAVIRGYGKLLNLPAADAIRWKMADKIANAMQDVLADMNLGTASTVNVSGVSKAVQKFVTARRNLEEMIIKIQYEEKRVSVLDKQLVEMEKIARTGTATRQYNRSAYPNYARDEVVYGNLQFWDGYLNANEPVNPNTPFTNRSGQIITGPGQEYWINGQPVNTGGQETVTTEMPSGNIQQVRYELMSLLAQMVGDYQRAIGLARRWPGALPIGLSQETLQKNLLSAQALYNGIQQMSAQGY